MKTSCWKWMIGYGIFLIAMGVAGFASNPEKAKTALLSGGTFGSLAILWGVLMAKKFPWATLVALAMTLLLTAVFSWRAWASWTAVAHGEPKIIAASIISAMLIASIATIPLLISDLARTPEKKPLSSR